MRKAITPIIAIIILLLITVALAGTAYSFLQGLLFPLQKSFQVPPGGSYCISTATDKKIIVYVVNTGYQSPLTQTDFIVKAVDGNPILALQSVNLQTGNGGKLIEVDCTVTTQCGPSATASVACCKNYGTTANPDYSGSHIVDLGTVAGVQHISVFCP